MPTSRHTLCKRFRSFDTTMKPNEKISNFLYLIYEDFVAIRVANDKYEWILRILLPYVLLSINFISDETKMRLNLSTIGSKSVNISMQIGSVYYILYVLEINQRYCL